MMHETLKTSFLKAEPLCLVKINDIDESIVSLDLGSALGLCSTVFDLNGRTKDGCPGKETMA